MSPIEERLFETYGEAALNELGHGFDQKKLEDWLKTLPISDKARYRVVDGLWDYYFHWASTAFSVGFHLGLALPDNNICRSGPEQVQ